jgi:hypothetical protein
MAPPPQHVGMPRGADGGGNGQASSPSKAAGKPPVAKPGGSAGKHGSKQAGSALQGLSSSRLATASSAAVPLMQHVSTLVDAARQEVAAAAKAYFAAKVSSCLGGGEVG